MSYDIKILKEAKKMRRRGYSFYEISKFFDISKSTASVWTSKEVLTTEGKLRILNRQNKARIKAFDTIAKNRENIRLEVIKNARQTIDHIDLNVPISKLLLAFLFWAEGDKNLSYLGFANSDPSMIETFLHLLRSSFNVDEAKLRALVHIHEYHNNEKVLSFWSKVTDIPKTQFSKSYLKTNTGLRKKEGYLGSMHLRYYDYKVARELASIYNMFVSRFI